MTYHLTLTDLSAMGVTAVSLNYRSLAADSASLRCPMGADLSSPLPWVEGDRLVLSDDRQPGTAAPHRSTLRAQASTWAGMGCFIFQTMLMGWLPSWLTYSTGPRKM